MSSLKQSLSCPCGRCLREGRGHACAKWDVKVRKKSQVQLEFADLTKQKQTVKYKKREETFQTQETTTTTSNTKTSLLHYCHFCFDCHCSHWSLFVSSKDVPFFILRSWFLHSVYCGFSSTRQILLSPLYYAQARPRSFANCASAMGW